MRRLALAGWLAVLTPLALEGRVLAEPSAADKAAAETLFMNARKLLAEGKYAEACKALTESQRLDPGVGTLLNLGRCYEKLGRTASAWSTYKEAAAAARAANQPAREKNARIAAEALEKKLPMLTIVVSRPESTPDLEVRRDGAVVPAGLWGMAIAVDPGEHVFEASARGRKTWRTQVVADAGKPLTVNIPVLELDKASGAAQPSANAASAPPPGPVVQKEQPKEELAPKKSSFGAQRVASILVGAAGVGAVSVGGYYGFRAKSLYDSADCFGPVCNTTAAKDQRDLATLKARNSTILVTTGLVAIAGAVVLWVTAPSETSESTTGSVPRQRLWVSPDVGPRGERSLTLSGTF